MYDKLMGAIQAAMDEAKSLPKSREAALVATKLEEAYLWYRRLQAIWSEGDSTGPRNP